MSEEGLALKILLLLFLVPLVGVAGLGVDVGKMYTERRSAQAVADLAAAAGAHEQTQQTPSGSFEAVVTVYAAENGFTAANGDSIVIHHPPLSGPNAGNTDAYEVIVQRPVKTALLRVLGRERTTVQGRAVALVRKSGIGILVLDPVKNESFKMNKHSSLVFAGGVLQVNSNAKQAMHIQDDSQITMGIPPGVVGGYKIDGHAKVKPLPKTDADPIPDPLAGLPEPPLTLPIQYGSAAHPQTKHVTDGDTLYPGIYYGGIDIDHHSDVTFDASGVPSSEAVFIMAGGGLHLHDGSSLTAHGVTIFNTDKSGGDPKDCGDLHFDNKASVDLTPPTGGTYEGVAIFQKRACDKHFNLSGKALSGIEGEIYVPNGEVKVQGEGDKKKRGVVLIKASFITRVLKIGNFDATNDPDEDPMEPAYVGPDPNLTINALTGASTRRVVIAE